MVLLGKECVIQEKNKIMSNENNIKKIYSVADSLGTLISKYRSELMGLCIIWIMLFHSGIPAPENIVLRAIWYLFVSLGGGFGVDIFLILSGFGLMFSGLKREDREKKESISSFYKRRLIRILPTYFVIAIIFYVIKFNNIGEFFYNVFFLNFIIDGKRDFWYIFAILLCYLIFPLYRFLVKKIDFRATFIISTLTVIAINLLLFYLASGLYNKWEIVLWRIPCFLIGCHLGFVVYRKKAVDFTMFVSILSIAGLILLAIFGYIRAPGMVERIELVVLSLALIVVFCLFFDLIGKIARWVNDVFAFLGVRSLELYLIHVSIGWYFADAITKSLGGGVFIRLMFNFVISIALSIIVKNVMDYIFNKIQKKNS